MTEISCYEDVIDSRDIIERIEELDSMKENEELNEEETEELEILIDLQEQCQGYASDWAYGATLIHEKYFTEYTEDMCNDIGVVDTRNDNWWIVIDWEKTADNVKMDYTEVDFNGETYYIR